MVGKIISYDSENRVLTLQIDEDVLRDILKKHCRCAEVRLDDGRRISAKQRKKIYATISDISIWSGHTPEFLKELFKFNFCGSKDIETFSLSDVDMTTARDFITYLIEFCFEYSVPLSDAAIDRTDDIGKYLYLCIEYRKCAVCGDHADIHHIDRIGMGNDRTEVHHLGRKAIALCRKHHNECHNNENEFLHKYHLFGIELDEYLCKKLKLRF